MNVRIGVPWIDPPAPHFSGHGYSELIASGLKYKISGKRVEVEIPVSLPVNKRDEHVANLKQLGFNGLLGFSYTLNQITNSFDYVIIVE